MSSSDRRYLYHCDTPLLVEPTRLCLATSLSSHVSVMEVSRPEWQNVYKARSPSGASPFLEVADCVLADPVAIYNFVASEGDRVPQSRKTEVHTIVDVVFDLLIRLESIRHRMDDATFRSAVEVEFPVTFKKLEEVLSCKKKGDTGGAEDESDLVDGPDAGDLLVSYLVAKAGMLNVTVPKECVKVMLIHEFCMKEDEVKDFFNKLTHQAPIPEIVGLSIPNEANPIRWAFAIGNVGFCYRYVAKENSDALKATDIRIPMLRVGDKTYTGRTAMLAYAAERSGLVPQSPVKAALAWSYVGNLSQLLDVLEKGSKQVVKKELPDLVAKIERMIGTEQDAEGHLVDSRLSFADLWCAMVYEKLCCTAPDSVGKLLKSIQTLAPNMRKCFDMVKGIELVRIFDYRLDQRPPVLTYFDISARAEPIRLIFNIGNIAFEDRRLTRDEWIDRHKSFSPTGQCPILEVNGRVFVETRAILGYAAERAGLVPPTPLGRMTAEMLHSAFGRVLTEQAKIHTVPKGVERDNMRNSIRETLLPPILTMMENLCSRDQHPAGYLVDNQLSWVDVYIASELQFMSTYRYLTEQARDQYPALFKVHDLVFSLPAVKEYQAQKSQQTTGGYSP